MSAGSGAATDGGSSCGAGLVYNNTATAGDFFDISDGYDVIDQGQLPAIASGGSADAYTITAFELGYVTNVAGSVDLEVTFWSIGALQNAFNSVQCVDFASLGTLNGGAPTASLTLTGLPGASVAGMQEAHIVTIDLTGMEFVMLGDGNGVTGDGDLFNWALRVLGQTAGDETGPLIAGDPLVCPPGAGTFGAAACGGGTDGTGFGARDRFRIDDTNGASPFPANCYNFGGYDPTTGVPFGSFYLSLSSDLANDECGGAIDLGVAIGPGVASGDTCCATTGALQPAACTADTVDSDVWLRWEAPATGSYTASTCGSAFDTRLAIWAGADCATAACIAYGDDDCGLQAEVPFAATAGDVFLFQLGGNESCGTWSLDLNADLCDPADDDQTFGEDDTCEEGTHLGDGALSGLQAFLGDPDHYTTVVCAGETLDVLVSFLHAEGNVDATLSDVSAGCSAAVLLASGVSSTDDEALSWTNNTGQPVEVSLAVELVDGDCSTYDLDLSGSCRIGMSYCGAGIQAPNTTGQVARITVAGSSFVVDDDLSLLASGLPPGELGYFVWARNPGMVPLPGISDGVLCLGGNSGRFNGMSGGPGAVLLASPGGTFVLSGIDTTMMPQSSSGPLAITAGLTGYFQAWYRDPGGTVGNHFTDAVELTWQ